MFWNDDDETDSSDSDNEILDYVFQLKGKTLPQNYLDAFSQALQSNAHWWHSQDKLSFHIIIAGEEGNGWFRDSDPGAVIYISRRNMLVIRGPAVISEEIQQLGGKEVDLETHQITLQHKHNKAIKPSPTLYSRYVVSEQVEETIFLQEMIEQLKKLNVVCKKLLCGKQRTLSINGKEYLTRSLMLEDLSKEDSLVIQVAGLGKHQKNGCGVFVPHKSIK